jgi:hypothetical protein
MQLFAQVNVANDVLMDDYWQVYENHNRLKANALKLIVYDSIWFFHFVQK